MTGGCQKNSAVDEETKKISGMEARSLLDRGRHGAPDGLLVD
jgi:hypothetical protein